MRKSQDTYCATCTDEFVSLLEPLEYECTRKNRRGKVWYVDVTATLDIETTNTPDDGFLYTIQLCIAGQCVLFRYVEDWIDCMQRIMDGMELNQERRLVLYVHNLGYEWYYMVQIMREAWGEPEGLYTKARKPLYIRFSNGLEFRDSLKLFQKSLAGATKGLPHEKLAGDLDYRMYRTPDTPLSPDEWNYCINDVLGLWEAIERLKKEHGYTQASIPLTNTGMVIEEVNRHIRKDGKTYIAMQELLLNKQQLHLAYKCMAGGDTHGTRWRAGRVYEWCNSADLKSAHPSEQILWKFPAGPVMDLEPDTPQEDMELLIDEGYGWIAKVFVWDFQVRPDCPDPIVSVSKCEDIHGRTGSDNGRLLGAEGAIIYMDSNDWQRFREAYTFGGMLAIEAVAFELKYLPNAFREAIMSKFVIKETAEDGPDRNFAKICVNTIFGACAQKTVRDEYTIMIEDLIESERLNWEDNLEAMEEKKVINSQKKKFPFLWGLWTASLTRLELWRLIKTVGWENAIYWDTDSVKYEGAKVPGIDTVFNARIRSQCKERNAVVLNRKGKEVYIGSAEDEHPTVDYGYRRFTFLHAKCYAAESWNDKKGRYEIETTIAGVGKREGIAALHGDISNLQEGLYIDDAGGLMLAYIDKPVTVRKDFKKETLSASFIYMKPRDYLIRGSGSMKEMLLIEEDYEVMSE